MCLNSDRSTITDGLERDLKICANVELVCGIQLNWSAEDEFKIGLPGGYCTVTGVIFHSVSQCFIMFNVFDVIGTGFRSFARFVRLFVHNIGSFNQYVAMCSSPVRSHIMSSSRRRPVC